MHITGAALISKSVVAQPKAILQLIATLGRQTTCALCIAPTIELLLIEALCIALLLHTLLVC